MKKRLMVIIPLLLIAALFIGGAVSYFNSAKDAPGQIKSGTLELKLSVDGTNWADSAVVWDVSNMAPGDTVEGKLWMLNTGSIASRQVTFDWKNVVNTPEAKNLADNIFLVSAYDSKNNAEAVDGFVSMADTNGDHKASLAEVAALSTRFNVPFGPYDATSDVAPFLPSNDPQWLYMKWQFNPDAGNDLQGATMNYGLTVTAWQKVIFPSLIP